MASFRKEVVEKLLEEDEEILDKVISPRKIGSASTHVYLTNKRIIYHKQKLLYQLFRIGEKYNEIQLESIEDMSYLPRPLHSGGLIEVYTVEGNKENLNPSYVGEDEAQRFIQKVRTQLNQ